MNFLEFCGSVEWKMYLRVLVCVCLLRKEMPVCRANPLLPPPRQLSPGEAAGGWGIIVLPVWLCLYNSVCGCRKGLLYSCHVIVYLPPQRTDYVDLCETLPVSLVHHCICHYLSCLNLISYLNSSYFHNSVAHRASCMSNIN